MWLNFELSEALSFGNQMIKKKKIENRKYTMHTMTCQKDENHITVTPLHKY
jgi:hypothetical protein